MLTYQPRAGGLWSGLSYRLLLTIYVPAVTVVAIVGVAARALGIDAGMFTRDPAHIFGAPFYTGLMSNLGVTVWGAAGAIALFAAALLPRTAEHREARWFLFWSGAVTLYLMLDDVAMLHDDVLMKTFHVREQVIFLAYLPIAVYYLRRFRRQLLGTAGGLVVLAAALMCFSLLCDNWHVFVRIFGRVIFPDSELLEDGSKFLSVATWSGFLVHRAAAALRTREAWVEDFAAAAGVEASGKAWPT